MYLHVETMKYRHKIKYSQLHYSEMIKGKKRTCCLHSFYPLKSHSMHQKAYIRSKLGHHLSLIHFR